MKRTLKLPEVHNDHLMPFRWKELDGRVLLTNDGGEYAWLEKAEFGDFLAGTLAEDSPAYRLLNDRHFLRSPDSEQALRAKIHARSGHLMLGPGLHIVILTRNGSHHEFVRLLKGRTASGLRKLGYRRVWQRRIWNRLIREEEDLAEAIADVLASRVRARIAWNWPAYPWCGSVEWPEIDEWFLGIRQGDQRFRDRLVNEIAS